MQVAASYKYINMFICHFSAPAEECHCDAYACMNSPSSYCTRCYKLFCSSCQEDHSKSHSLGVTNPYLPIRYDSTIDKYVVVCSKHLTAGNYLCNCSINKFICVYCKQRDHRNHNFVNISETAKEIKNKLNGDVIDTVLRNTFSISKQRETLIPECRNLLMETLKVRKVKELSSYLSYLNDEELRLMAKFDTLASAHLLNYNADGMKSFIEDFERILQKEDFQIVVKGNHIIDILNKYTNITSVKINLSEKQNEKYPLGDFSLEYDIVSDVEDKEMKCNFSHNLTLISDVEEEIKKLMENLNDLLPEGNRFIYFTFDTLVKNIYKHGLKLQSNVFRYCLCKLGLINFH